MGAFHYKALTPEGKIKKGVLQGDNTRSISQQLKEQHLSPLEIHSVAETQKSNSSFLSFTRQKRLATADLALLTRQLATLLKAGLPVEESLGGVADQIEKQHIKGVVQGVRARVMEGRSLADSMREFPNAFPELYCATVGAGEQTGRLDLVLNRLADYTEQQQRMKQKVQQALIYPSMMTLVSIGIVTFLLVFVVPKIVGVFSSTGQKLPEVTLLLIGISAFLKTKGLYVLLILLALFIGFRKALQRKTFRYRWHRFLMKLPFIGFALKTINTARFSRTFGILSTAGVSVLEAMRVSAKLITVLPMSEAVTIATQRVREGANIHYALKQTGYFSAMTIHLISTGESSGQLEEMLERAAESEDNDVTRLIETGLTLFEPLIILMMGAVVLFIVLAILLPIFELNQITG